MIETNNDALLGDELSVNILNNQLQDDSEDTYFDKKDMLEDNHKKIE